MLFRQCDRQEANGLSWGGVMRRNEVWFRLANSPVIAGSDIRYHTCIVNSFELTC